LLYAIFFIYVIWFWTHQPKPNNVITNQDIGITVIVAVRDEEENVLNCIYSILNNKLNSGCFELIVINDHSTDGTVSLLETINRSNYKYFNLPEYTTGKKRAIAFGVEKSKFPIILCTDGDCIVGQKWIQTMAMSLSYNQKSFATGIVLPRYVNSALGYFQQLDFMASMVLTFFGIKKKLFFLANGANMIFYKSVFQDINGFEGNENIASGDDVFLMQKFIQAKGEDTLGFSFEDEGLVFTKSEKSWKELWQQRKRWATKLKALNDYKLMIIQGFVFIVALTTISSFIMSFIYSFLFTSFLILFFGKMIVDFYFLKNVSKSLKIYFDIQYFASSFIIYYGHIIISGLHALMPTKYTWKKRKI
jgi:poly-beta-1,6-N-acetyl-D-glucosamine synthase